MESAETLAKTLQNYGGWGLAAVLLIVIGALFKVWRDEQASAREFERQLYAKHAEQLAAANAAHLQTAMQVAPLASKLVTCVELVERMSGLRAST